MEKIILNKPKNIDRFTKIVTLINLGYNTNQIHKRCPEASLYLIYYYYTYFKDYDKWLKLRNKRIKYIKRSNIKIRKKRKEYYKVNKIRKVKSKPYVKKPYKGIRFFRNKLLKQGFYLDAKGVKKPIIPNEFFNRISILDRDRQDIYKHIVFKNSQLKLNSFNPENGILKFTILGSQREVFFKRDILVYLKDIITQKTLWLHH